MVKDISEKTADLSDSWTFSLKLPQNDRNWRWHVWDKRSTENRTWNDERTSAVAVWGTAWITMITPQRPLAFFFQHRDEGCTLTKVFCLWKQNQPFLIKYCGGCFFFCECVSNEGDYSISHCSRALCSVNSSWSLRTNARFLFSKQPFFTFQTKSTNQSAVELSTDFETRHKSKTTPKTFSVSRKQKKLQNWKNPQNSKQKSWQLTHWNETKTTIWVPELQLQILESLPLDRNKKTPGKFCPTWYRVRCCRELQFGSVKCMTGKSSNWVGCLPFILHLIRPALDIMSRIKFPALISVKLIWRRPLRVWLFLAEMSLTFGSAGSYTQWSPRNANQLVSKPSQPEQKKNTQRHARKIVQTLGSSDMRAIIPGERQSLSKSNNPFSCLLSSLFLGMRIKLINLMWRYSSAKEEESCSFCLAKSV